MALLTVQPFPTGGAPAFVAAAAGGDTVPTPEAGRAAGWDLGVMVVVRNASVAAITVTVEGLTGISVPAGGAAVVPIFRKHFGIARSITYSAVASVTVAAVRLSG